MKLKMRITIVTMLTTLQLALFFQPLNGQGVALNSGSIVKRIYTPQQWKDDVDYLVKRLEIMHPMLYANISKEKFQMYADKLKEKANGFSDNEMIIGINELIAHVRSLHTFCMPVIFSQGIDTLKNNYKYYPVKFHPFADGVYVVAASPKYEKALGKKVIKMGNLSVEEVMKRLARLTAADNEMTILDHVPRYYMHDGPMLCFVGASSSSNNITLQLEDDDRNVTDYSITTEPAIERSLTYAYAATTAAVTAMNNVSNNPLPLYLKKPRDYYWFEYLNDQKAIYLQINVFQHKNDERFDKFCKRMFDTFDEKKAERLIIDIRLNGGGNHIELLLLKGILNRPNLDKPENLSVIISRTTVSAAQHFTSELKWYTNATFYGEPTCSKPNQYGAIRRFNLPNSKLQIGCPVDYYQDAQPFDFSVKTDPDFYVNITSADFKNNHDPILDAVLNNVSYKNLRTEFTSKLSEAYKKGNLESLIKTYNLIKPNYSKYGFNMEVLLYNDFDGWMYNNKINDDDYLGYLKFMHSELPNSLNVCYDLAVNLIPKNKEEARKLFNKCLEINPEHSYAKMQLDLLKLEESQAAKSK